MSTFAYLTLDRHLHVVDAQGDRALSGDLEGVAFGSWMTQNAEIEAHSWPTFSPDGKQLASFSVPDGAKQARVLVNSVDGVTAEELAALDGRLPIYMQWHPGSERLALLTQERDQLVLSTVTCGAIGAEKRLLEGSPMFLTWWRGDLAVFAGTSEGPTLAVVDPSGIRSLPRHPGNFCAPVAMGDELAYVASDGDNGPLLLLAKPDGALRELCEVNGLSAFLRSPNGKSLAIATAESENAPYRSLRILDVESLEDHLVSDDPCMAFLWRPDGKALVRARVDTVHNSLHWDQIDLNGVTTPLIELHPTRDLSFYLRFFEQYGQSHPLICPDSKTLLVTGARIGDAFSRPVVWKVPLDGSEPEEVAPGMFAVYSWR